MIFKNKTYDILTWIAEAITPIMAFVTAVAPVFGASEALTNSIVIVLGAIGTLMLALLKKASVSYHKAQADMAQSITEKSQIDMEEQ